MTLRWLVPGLAIALVSVLVAAGAPGAAQDDIVPGRTVHERLAYGIYTCDEFQEPIDDRLGARTIHTHGDGLIHIHPEADTARTDLDLAAFAEQAGIDRTETGIAIEDGFAWETCAGGPAEVVVLRWSSDALDSPPTVLRQPWDQIDLLDGGDVVTIAVLPAGTDPSSSTDQRYVPPWVEHLDDETGIGTEPIPVGEVSEDAMSSYEALFEQ
ncbi:MAG: hypothetical protein KDB36_17655, partial [Acidimicrobiales bacterium]|nr:hypothetical protein [Acidimicrobiales bacterium]